MAEIRFNETKELIRLIMTSTGIRELAYAIEDVIRAKKLLRVTPQQYSQLLELGAKKEALLHAQGKG